MLYPGTCQVAMECRGDPFLGQWWTCRGCSLRVFKVIILHLRAELAVEWTRCQCNAELMHRPISRNRFTSFLKFQIWFSTKDVIITSDSIHQYTSNSWEGTKTKEWGWADTLHSRNKDDCEVLSCLSHDKREFILVLSNFLFFFFLNSSCLENYEKMYGTWFYSKIPYLL